jgi:hypothetical protein
MQDKIQIFPIELKCGAVGAEVGLPFRESWGGICQGE